jgi:hypothetical protein
MNGMRICRRSRIILFVAKVASSTETGIWKVRIARNPATAWNPRQPEDKSEGDRTERGHWITNM